MTREEKLNRKILRAAKDIVAACDEFENVYAVDSLTLHTSKKSAQESKVLAERIVSNLDLAQMVSKINTETFGS